MAKKELPIVQHTEERNRNNKKDTQAKTGEANE